mmetsp:Transcript_138394/g.386028  ORF Transcript_138394/g.386028 Transcript_138394/m.386028 type:complete len:229 (+) Transcript_138394:108-794(+)
MSWLPWVLQTPHWWLPAMGSVAAQVKPVPAPLASAPARQRSLPFGLQCQQRSCGGAVWAAAVRASHRVSAPLQCQRAVQQRPLAPVAPHAASTGGSGCGCLRRLGPVGARSLQGRRCWGHSPRLETADAGVTPRRASWCSSTWPSSCMSGSPCSAGGAPSTPGTCSTTRPGSIPSSWFLRHSATGPIGTSRATFLGCTSLAEQWRSSAVRQGSLPLTSFAESLPTWQA